MRKFGSFIGALAASFIGPATQSSAQDLGRPLLEAHRGQYFQWLAPHGWRFSETMSGLSMYSPDGREYVGVAAIMQTPGSSTPEAHLLNVVSRIPGYREFRITNIQDLPGRPSWIPGLSWTMREIELSCTVEGKPVIGRWTVGVLNYSGYFNGSINGFSATVDRWPVARLYLPQVAKSVLVHNLTGMGGQDQVMRPRNNPLDNRALIEAFKNRGASQSRISEMIRQGTMGYALGKDPSSGEVYSVPLEYYDPNVGGFRNPNRPGELLQELRPE